MNVRKNAKTVFKDLKKQIWKNFQIDQRIYSNIVTIRLYKQLYIIYMETLEDYYRVSIFITLRDTIIQQLNECINDYKEVISDFE